MKHLCFILLFFAFYFIPFNAMMLRNDALISRMVSNFQKDNTPGIDATPKSIVDNPNVISLMQNVLCKNFPSIPCRMIIEDEALRTLIQRSIEQLKYKKLTMGNTTPAPDYHLTLYPTIDSEDLSNFLQVSDTGYYKKNKQEKIRTRKHKKRLSKINAEDNEQKKNNNKKNDRQRSQMYTGHKKLTKLYPHKIKYKDKVEPATRNNNNYRDYSEEKYSMSVENPETNSRKKRLNTNYITRQADVPVWRVDYLKHGESSFNVFDYEPDRLKEKLVKTGPNGIVSDNILEQAPRKDVLHPDVYIKKNYRRKNALALDSIGMDR